MKREEKTKKVAKLNERFKAAKLVVLTDFTGLNVSEMTDLRAKLKEAASEYQVVKNTLLRLAARETAMEQLTEHFIGPNGLVLADEDVVAPAKALYKFAAESKKLAIKAGLLEDGVITSEDIKSLATLPSREVLLAQLLGAMNAAPAGLVNVLAALLRNLLNVLKAVEEKKAQAAA